MLTTFAFDVCHDVYRAAREAIETKIPTLNAEASGKYLWRPDRMPRLAEYVCDFERAGERALGGGGCHQAGRVQIFQARGGDGTRFGGLHEVKSEQAEGRSTFRASRMTLFRLYYVGGAEYGAARRHLGISEVTWADWAEEIRRAVGRELTRAGVFPPSKYFRETTEKAS